jgi:hypothetical protein
MHGQIGGGNSGFSAKLVENPLKSALSETARDAHAALKTAQKHRLKRRGDRTTARKHLAVYWPDFVSRA